MNIGLELIVYAVIGWVVFFLTYTLPYMIKYKRGKL